MVDIRAATVDDIPALIAMGRAMHAESPTYSRFAFSSEKLGHLLRSMIEDTLAVDAPGGAVVAVKDGIVIGVVLGFVTPLFFSDETVASDYALYVKPEHRGIARVAKRLIEAFGRWAVAQGVRDIVPAVSTQIDPEGTAALYQHLGYEKQGYILRKQVS